MYFYLLTWADKKEEINSITSDIQKLILNVIWGLLIKMDVPEEKATEILKNVKEGKDMGVLFENFQTFDWRGANEELARTKAELEQTKVDLEQAKARAKAKADLEQTKAKAKADLEQVEARAKQAEEKAQRLEKELQDLKNALIS